MITRAMLALAVGLAVWGLIELLGRWRKTRRRSSLPEGWVTAEEAARREAAVIAKWKRRLEEGGELTSDEGLQFFKERAEAARIGPPDVGSIRLGISIPLSIGPMDRGERFETPLMEALGTEGSVNGGGTWLAEQKGDMKIEEARISVTVVDLERGLSLIRACLRQQGAPKGTRILHEGKAYSLYEEDPTSTS